MGGHGHDHGHHHEPYKVPKPEIYKVGNIPELIMVQEELAKRGLKDPWIRNEVWRYDTKVWGHRRIRIIKFLFRGFPLGLAAFGATVGVEYALGVYDNPHGHGDGHGAHGAHGGHGEH